MSESSDFAKSCTSQNGGHNVTKRKPCPMQRVSTDGERTGIFNAGLRLPSFYPDDPEVWFTQVEALFANAGITGDSTKFNYVIGNLDHQYSREVKDILLAPSAADKYNKLKTELIKRLSASQERKVKQLLMHEDLGDRKPSQFLRHLQNLAGQNVPEDFLRTIWCSRLPGDIQTLLASQPHSSLETLADLADRVQDIASPPHHIAATSAHGPSLQSMAGEIAELRRMVQDLTLELGRRPRSRTRHQRCDGSESSRRSESSYRRYPICWYHQRFRDGATKCIKPCDFSKAGNSQSSR
ncbi:uncharacterized protein LOC125075559 [Vanessa atalanta]|uniref:uncharacterized protein LOC125075559 n=1 Tax=Vanessa atalanta TaxID=42275 RepID=UPI001FCD8CBD|nr:uncharacterized protein LOC125075559 [Vanessa atalanta]